MKIELQYGVDMLEDEVSGISMSWIIQLKWVRVVANYLHIVLSNVKVMRENANKVIVRTVKRFWIELVMVACKIDCKC